jgi:hypothetical protein
VDKALNVSSDDSDGREIHIIDSFMFIRQKKAPLVTTLCQQVFAR